MLNLIIKDVIIQKKEKTFWIAILANFLSALITAGNSGLAVIIPFFSIYLMLVYSNAFDYKYNAEVMVNSMPVNRKDIILAKYISVYFYLIVAMLLTYAGDCLFKVLGISHSQSLLSISFLCVNIFLASVYYAIFFPFYYKLGYIRSRWVNFIAMLVVSFLGTVIGRMGEANTQMLAVKTAAYADPSIEKIAIAGQLFVLVAVSCLFILVSLTISLKIYKNKEF